MALAAVTACLLAVAAVVVAGETAASGPLVRLPPYAVLVDAGSSGSRLTVFAVGVPDTTTSLADLLPTLTPASGASTLKVEPGTSPTPGRRRRARAVVAAL